MHLQTRRAFMQSIGAGAFLASAGCAFSRGNGASRPPNIVYILADDLGYNDVGCYGQTKIRTPQIDALAREGMRFTQHYSGSAVCAPTRCMLLTGKDAGHAYIRANDEMGERGDVWNDPALEGQRPLPENTETMAWMLKRAGYRTACIGKWGLGWVGSSGEPARQGFDLFFGYNCQRVAHNYYPTHLWRNNEKVLLDNPAFKAHQKFPEGLDPLDPASYAPYKGRDYAPDLMLKEALNFIQENRDRPFFLYFATTVPHVALQVPDDALKEYEGAFPETPYGGEKGYLPHRAPRAAYAAMITRMDRGVGALVEALDRLGLGKDTLVLFSSDNGPTYAGGVDVAFFESNKPFQGLKGSLLEGGIRVPMIARWPGRVREGSTTDLPSAQWDVMATVADACGVEAKDTDGISFLPTLLGRGDQKRHDYLYWEYNNQQAVRLGDWKGSRRNARKFPDEAIRLYDLKNDVREERDVAGEHPGIVDRMAAIMNGREPSVFEKWNFPAAKGTSALNEENRE